MVAEENNRIVGGGLLLKGVIEEVNCASFFQSDHLESEREEVRKERDATN